MEIFEFENVDSWRFLEYNRAMITLKRKAYDQIAAWKNSKDHKCLLIRGARQVGKSFVVSLFANANYEEVLTINFKETPDAAEIFSGNLDVKSMVMAMRFRYPDYSITPEKTLIFLDEIQECEEAVTSLKFWAMDNSFDVIASGSMLGIDYKRASSFPVGYVDFLDMYGLDFEEFLWSQNINSYMISELRQMFIDNTPVPPAVHSKMMTLFRTFIGIGGMPEVVRQFTETGDFRVADKTQRELLQGYQYDIAHYATAEEKLKAEKCFLSLSRQLLGKENHKFQYKEVEHNGKAQKYYSSLEWLVRADMIKLARNVTFPLFDLEDFSIADNFRVYTSDLSLLLAMRDYSLKMQIVENSLTGTTKGGIYECAIADILTKKPYSIWFYRNETKKQEIDFLIQKEGTVIPIEVKSGNTRATSLNSIMKNNPEIQLAYKLIDGNVGEPENRILSIPLYMAMFL